MSGLSHQFQLSHELSRRAREGDRYRDVLNRVLGFSTDNVLISTSEHVAPFNRASTLSFVLPQLALLSTYLREPRTVLILAGSLIPLDNSHYPRGFFLPERSGRSDRFNLYPQAMRKAAPVLLPPVQGMECSKADVFLRLYPWLRPALAEVGSFETFADQLANCMEAIANQWFGGKVSSKLRVRPLEVVASRILVQLIEEQDPVINSILFRSERRNQIARELHGVFCAWGDRQGSFLFWANHGSHPLRLREREGFLAGDEIEVELEKYAIVEGLRARLLWPGVFLSLFAVSYLPNLPVSGGPKQLNYYRRMIRAANLVSGLGRPLRLSQPGYMSFDLCCLRSRRDEVRLIPDFGAGLALSSSQLDVEYFLEQLGTTAILEPAGKDYRYE